MSLFARQHTAGQSDIEKALGKKLVDCTKEEILALFPENATWDRWGETSSNLRLTIYPDLWTKEKTWRQRLNHIWVLPLYCIILGPVLWICTGRFGVEPSSKFGTVLKKLVGE